MAKDINKLNYKYIYVMLNYNNKLYPIAENVILGLKNVEMVQHHNT